MAGNKALALRLAERERPAAAVVDLFLADGMTGLAVVRELHERHGTVCLLSTAFAGSVRGDDPLAWGLVGKPYPREALGHALAYCLGLAAGRPPDLPPQTGSSCCASAPPPPRPGTSPASPRPPGSAGPPAPSAPPAPGRRRRASPSPGPGSAASRRARQVVAP